MSRFWVIFLSLLLPILAMVGAGIVAGVIWFLISKTNSVAAAITAVIFVIGFILAYIYAILWAGTAQLVALRDTEAKTGVIENLKRSRPLIWSVFLVGLLTNLVVMGGFMLLIVPGIILMTRYGFASIIMIMEGKKGRSALTQSKAYVYGKSWKVFGRMFLLYLIYLVPYIILEAVSLTNKGGVAGIVATILLIILQIVFSVYLISFMFTLYKQLKNSAGTVNGEQYRGAVTGWAIWGGVSFVLFFVIGLGSSVVLLALNSARAKARDAKRVADVRQIAAGEELYYNDNNSYPSTLQNLETNYLGQVPTPPQPADGFCTIGENQYSYKLLDSGHYELTFCLGEVTNGYPAGKNTLTEKGIDVGHVSDTPDMQAPLNIPAQ